MSTGKRLILTVVAIAAGPLILTTPATAAPAAYTYKSTSGSIGCPPDTQIVVGANTTITGASSWTTLLAVGASTSPSDLIVYAQYNNENGYFSKGSGKRGNAWGVTWGRDGGKFVTTTAGADCN